MRAPCLILMFWLLLGNTWCLGQNVFSVQWKKSEEAQYKSRVFQEIGSARLFADSIRNVWTENGFLQTEVGQQQRLDTLFIHIDSGPLFFWEELRMGEVPQKLWTRIGMSGKNYSEPYGWMEKVVREAENHGYPFPKIWLDSVKIEGESLSGVFVFEEGPLITWDSLVVSGDTKTQQRYLQQFSGILPGAVFSQSDLEKSIQRIKRSPYFSLASVPELNFQIKTAKPYFILKDRKINVFDGVIGLIPNQNEPNTLLLTGELNLDLYHLGGKGRDFSVHWQRLNIQSQSLEVSAKESFLFRSPLDLQLNFSLLKQDSSFVNRTFQIDFGYRISDSGYLKFFNRRQSGDLIGTSERTSPLPTSLDYRWNQYGIGSTWDWLDDPFFARRGAILTTEISLGNKRVIENTALPVELYQEIPRSSPQFQGMVNAEKHLFLKPFLGLYFRLNGAIMKNENLFLNEFYRLGGLRSIRGFNEKFFFADRYAFFSAEQRVFFGDNSFLMVFGDFGVLNNPYFSPKNDKPRSFGLGINLDTEGGLFSFVFGLGSSNMQPLSFSYSRIHFGYLARF